MKQSGKIQIGQGWGATVLAFLSFR